MSARFVLTIALALAFPTQAAAQSGSRGDSLAALAEAAERAGRHGEALRLYTEFRQRWADVGDGYVDVSRKMFRVAAAVRPPLAVPDSALIYEGRGRAAAQRARTRADFTNAAYEYSNAIRLAPWIPRYYQLYALLLERGDGLLTRDDNYYRAVDNLRVYALTLSDSAAITANRVKIAELEYVIEQLAADRARYAAFERWLDNHFNRYLHVEGKWHLLSGPYVMTRVADTLFITTEDTRCCSVILRPSQEHPMLRGIIRGAGMSDVSWEQWLDPQRSQCVGRWEAHWRPVPSMRVARWPNGNEYLRWIPPAIGGVGSSNHCEITETEDAEYGLWAI